jgi:Ulp1 family protease
MFQDVDVVLHEEVLNVKMPKEAQKAVQEIVWPSDDPNPVTIKASNFESLQEGQPLSDTIIDFYLKYLDRRHKWTKGFHFFNSFFFRKLDDVYQDTTNGYKKIERWTRNINIFIQDYVFLPILLR